MIDFKSQARDIQDECGTSWTKFKKAPKNFILSKGPKGKPEVLFFGHKWEISEYSSNGNSCSNNNINKTNKYN